MNAAAAPRDCSLLRLLYIHIYLRSPIFRLQQMFMGGATLKAIWKGFFRSRTRKIGKSRSYRYVSLRTSTKYRFQQEPRFHHFTIRTGSILIFPRVHHPLSYYCTRSPSQYVQVSWTTISWHTGATPSLLLSRVYHHHSCYKVFIICPIMHGPRPFVLQYLSCYHLSCYPGSSTICHAVHGTPPSILLHWAHHHYSCYTGSSTTCLTIQDPPPSVLLYIFQFHLFYY